MRTQSFLVVALSAAALLSPDVCGAEGHAAEDHALKGNAAVDKPDEVPGDTRQQDESPSAAETSATETSSAETGAAETSAPKTSAVEPKSVDVPVSDEVTASRPTVFGRPIKRDGFHFHFSFGPGGGPDTVGLYHAMELGWSFYGYTVALLHTFLQNKGIFGTTKGGPDEIGGFMLQLQGPLYFDDLVWKVASGVGGTIDQPNGEFNANPGFGIHYGVDLHFPIWPKFGPTLSLAFMNVFEGGDHHFAAATALGLTVF